MYPIPDKVNGEDELDDSEFNPFKNEIINAIESAGITISDTDDFQTAKAMATYSANSTYYNDTGIANAYVLTPLANFESPSAYGEGMHVRFYVANSNTGSSTVNVNSLGVKNIKTLSGDNLSADDLIAGDYVDLIYDGTDFILYYTTSGSSAFGSSRKNLLINSDFEFWQRVNPVAATSVATAGYYCDRFRSYAGSGGSPAATVTRKLLTPGTVLPNNGGTPRYAYTHAQTAVATSAAPYSSQKIEDVYTASGQAITISFWARLNSGTLTITPSVKQNFGSGGSSDVDTAGSAITLSVSGNFTKYTQRIIVPSISGKTVGDNSFLEQFLNFSLNNTFNVDIVRRQVEIGSRATAYEKRTSQQEMDDCYRYYETSYNFDDYPGKITAPTYYGLQAPAGGVNVFYKAKKIKTPTGTTYDPVTGAAGVWDHPGGGPNSATFEWLSEYACVITTLTGNRGHYAIDAEL